MSKITAYDVKTSLVLHYIDYLVPMLSSTTVLTRTSSLMENTCCHDGENSGDGVEKPLLVCCAWTSA